MSEKTAVFKSKRRVEKPIKEVMCARQQSLMRQVHKEVDSDVVSCSTDTSRWSTPSTLHCGYNSSPYSSDYEDQANSLPVKNTDAESADKWQGPTPRRKAHGPHRKKIYHAASHQFLKLPPIKSLQVSGPRNLFANLSSIRELKSQVSDLQQQLSEARSENKLLKRLQHRHMVALQHFQDSEDSQIITKHKNEARVLQGMLRETRACRNTLARHLQATENKLLNTKATLQHLQVLSQDQNLPEREALTLRLTNATAELEEKDKRILDLEKNLELCQASFNRQLVTEQRKTNEAKKLSCYQQELILQLSRDIQDRQRELETHNIYSHRFFKGFTKRGRESKMVQTDGLIPLPTQAVNLLELEYSETEERLEEQESSVNQCCHSPVQKSVIIEITQGQILAKAKLEENQPEPRGTPQEDTKTYADTSEQKSCSEESLQDQAKGDCVEEKEPPEAPRVLEEELETEEQESDVSYISVMSEKYLNTAEPTRKGYQLSKIRRNYTFKQTIENLHNGKPAYSSVDLNPSESTK